jgi:thiamine pyrophosphokinase
MIALLVAAAPVAGSAELLAKLAPEADLVIAVDAGAEICRDAGITPGAVLGDFDSLSAETRSFFCDAGVPLVTFPAEKDETDFELAIAYARERGATQLWATAASAKRLDHTLASVGALLLADDLSPQLIEPDSRAWVLSPRGRASVTLTGVGATVSLVALPSDAVVSETGARWPLERHLLAAGSGLGIANVIVSEQGLTASVHAGVVLVIAPLMEDGRQARLAAP